MNDRQQPDPVAPEVADADLHLTPPATAAGGMKSVAVALTQSVTQMGLKRSASTLLDVNQQSGFDCPGCAWPEAAQHRSRFEFCENGAKAIAEEATLARATPEFFARHSVAELARQSDHWLSQQGRLTHPMVLDTRADHYRAIDWDAAFALIAAELNSLASPDEAVFYTSGRTSNEAAFLYQLFARLLGTNNLPDCSNLCHESSGYAMSRSIGSGKGTVLLDDFARADCILVIGQNPGTNHPRMLRTLQEAAARGCAIISVNPLREAGLSRFKDPQQVAGLLGRGSRIASRHLPIRINGDVALLKGLQKAILEIAVNNPAAIDRAFIDAHTVGFDAHAADLAGESWAAIVDSSGIPEGEIRQVAAVIAQSKAMICCWAMGVTQHQNAVANIQQIINLLLLGGHLGRPGAGACPVRGHSNVQGDRTMGICERPSRDFLRALGREFHFSPPTTDGFSVVEAIEAMHAGKVRLFMAMGGNFLSASPDTRYTGAALQKCTLTVQVSTKLNRSHLVTGARALILPCLGRTERDVQAGGAQFVTVEDSMGCVHASRGALDPASEHLLSEPRLIARLAKAALPPITSIDWDALTSDYSAIRNHISRVVPGFEDFDRRSRSPGGFTLPHAVRDSREFRTASGKAHFHVHQIPRCDCPTGKFLLTTIRSHDQFNTTIYGLDDRYRGIIGGRRVVFMNPQDIGALGLQGGALVDISSNYGGVERVAHQFRLVPYEIPRGCLATYFPEGNVLIPAGLVAEGSLTPASKSVVVAITPAR